MLDNSTLVQRKNQVPTKTIQVIDLFFNKETGI